MIATLVLNASAQEPNNQARTLLLKSYALAQHAPAAERAEVLSGQVRVAAKIDSDLAKQWAEELFGLSKALPETRRYMPQQSAVSAMTAVDPLRAYRMAREIKRPANYGLVGTYVDLGMSDILISLLKQQGLGALPAVQSILRDLSGFREYPYRGVQTWLRVLQDRPSEKRELFEGAASSYFAAPENAPDFPNFLADSSAAVPSNIARPVMTRLVNRLLDDSTSSSDFYGRISFRDGSMLEFRSPSTATLIRLLPAIESLDGALLQRVLATRPELVRVARGENTGLQSVSAKNAGPEMLEDFGTLVDPEKAVLAAKSKQDPEGRARALVESADSFSMADATRSQEILAEAYGLVTHIQNPKSEVVMLASIANSALRHGDRAFALNALKQGLARVRDSETVPDSADADLSARRYQYAIDELAEVAGAVDTATILEYADEQQSPILQSRLLLLAASGILRGEEEERHRQELERLRRLNLQSTKTE